MTDHVDRETLCRTADRLARERSAAKLARYNSAVSATAEHESLGQQRHGISFGLCVFAACVGVLAACYRFGVWLVSGWKP